MCNIGLCFIGVVKNASRKFLMLYLSTIELEEQSDQKEIYIVDDGICMDGQ